MKPFNLSETDIQELLQDAIIKAGTASKLAKEINCCRQSVCAWIDGTTPPRRDNVAKLLNYLNQTPKDRYPPNYLSKTAQGICDDCGEYHEEKHTLFVLNYCKKCTNLRRA